MRRVRRALLALALLAAVRGECENACSGHGRCTLFDMCICDRNWQSSDCGDRTCLFGPAVADTPKGDLDSSGEHELPGELVVVNDAVYPYGTSELFPDVVDSDFRVKTDSAHAYAECSNAGLCDRSTGICSCFTGFEGAACHRMPCPGSSPCSGHGICQSLRRLAKEPGGAGHYRLWDRDLVQGCKCDPGYYGGDCSMRRCRYGVDPLYLDDNQAIQYPFFFFAVMTTATAYDLSNGHAQPGTGYFTLTVFDQFGDDYQTRPIAAPASCSDLVDALEALPHHMFPAGRTQCFRRQVLHADANNETDFRITYQGLYRHYLSGTRYNTIESNPTDLSAGYTASFLPPGADPTLTGDLYLLQFFGNHYNFGQPQINIFLGDGSRASLVSPGGTLVTRVWTNGQQGLGVDYFNHRCDRINVRLTSFEGSTYLTGTFRLDGLQRCLGAADDDSSNDEREPWGTFDRGTIFTPHVIRLVRMQQESSEGGHLAVVMWEPLVSGLDAQLGQPQPGAAGGAYRLLHPLRPLDDNPFNYYDVYASGGRAQLVQNHTQAVFDFGSNHIYTVNATDAGGRAVGDDYDGDVSCDALRRRQRDGTQVFPDPSDSNNQCLERGDLFFVLDPYNSSYNAPYANIYRATGLVSAQPEELTELEDLVRGDAAVGAKLWRRNLIVTDYNTNWAASYGTAARFHIYRFRPNAKKTYHYSAECASRGVCNTFEGTCECFSGYGGDGCQSQEAIVS